MKKIFCLLLLVVSPLAARVRFFGFAQQGGGTIQTSGLNGVPKAQVTYPGATVTPYITGGAVGLVTTSGTAVTLVSGTPFNPNGQWNGLTITINSSSYTISSCSTFTACTISSSAGTQTSVAYSISQAPAAIYSDDTYPGTAITGSVTASLTTGYYSFYADTQTLDLRFSGTGIVTPFTLAAQSGIDPQTIPRTLSDRYFFQNGYTLAQAAAATLPGQTLSVESFWPAVPTESLTASIQCNGGTIQPASTAVVTLAGPFSWMTLKKCFDYTLSGNSSSTYTPIVLSGAMTSPPDPILFGADPTGNADSTPAMNNAINAAQAGQKNTVKFSAGKYSICPATINGSETNKVAIVFYNNMTLTADGTVNFAESNPGTYLLVAAGCNGDVFGSWTWNNESEFPHGVTIEKMTIDGGSGNSTTAGFGINTWRTGENFLLRQLVIQNMPQGCIQDWDNQAEAHFEDIQCGSTTQSNAPGFDFEQITARYPTMISVHGDNTKGPLFLINGGANNGINIFGGKAESTISGVMPNVIKLVNPSGTRVLIEGFGLNNTGGGCSSTNSAGTNAFVWIDNSGYEPTVTAINNYIPCYWALYDSNLSKGIVSLENSTAGGFGQSFFWNGNTYIAGPQSLFGVMADGSTPLYPLHVKGVGNDTNGVAGIEADNQALIRTFVDAGSGNTVVASGNTAGATPTCFAGITGGAISGTVGAQNNCIYPQGLMSTKVFQGGVNALGSTSGTIAFNLQLGTTQSVTLTGNSTSTFSNGSLGGFYTFIICQDSTGSRTFSFPSGFHGAMTIGSNANECSAQTFFATATNVLYAVTPGVANQ